MAQAELKASRDTAQQTENDVALKVHQLYYRILIAEVHRSATEARIQASRDLQSERVEQVKFGSTLQQELIDSRAEMLQAKQELLTTDLQLSDLKLQLNDAMGQPLTTPLDLDPNAEEFQPECERGTCVKLALEAHPEITAARHEVEKAAAAVHLAKVDIGLPDTYAFARYSYQNNVPFLARNFGTFGVSFSYDLFEHGAALRSQADLGIAQEYDAKTLLLQSQLDYTQAHDEITNAMGRTPE